MSKRTKCIVGLCCASVSSVLMLRAQAATFSSTAVQDTWVGFNGGSDFGNRNNDSNIESQGGFEETARASRILLKWDLSSIPADATINSATLHIQSGRLYSNGAQEGLVEVRAIVPGNPWNESTANWVYYDGTTNLWFGGVGANPGGSLEGTGGALDSNVQASFTYPAGIINQPLTTVLGGPVNLDMASLVAQWVAGTYDNNGISMQLGPGLSAAAPYAFNVPSADTGVNQALAPLLLIDYTATSAAAWKLDVSGDWNSGANWVGDVPNAVDAVANFGGVIQTAQTVYTNSEVTLGGLNFNNANMYVLTGAGSLSLEVTTGAATIDVQSGSHKINLPLEFTSDTDITVAGGATLTIADPAVIKANKTVTKTGDLVISAPLTLEAGASLVTGSGASQIFGAASIGTGGKIDVQNNSLQINYAGQATPAATVLGQLTSGYNNGSWDGEGIMTSSATAATGLGWVDDSANEMINVVYTYNGDTDVDGDVDSMDFNAFVAGYGQTAGGIWAEGDFNYDGKVDTRDFNFLAGNFGADPLPAAPLGAAVPEPGSASVLSIALAGLWIRCRRRHRQP